MYATEWFTVQNQVCGYVMVGHDCMHNVLVLQLPTTKAQWHQQQNSGRKSEDTNSRCNESEGSKAGRQGQQNYIGSCYMTTQPVHVRRTSLLGFWL